MDNKEIARGIVDEWVTIDEHTKVLPRIPIRNQMEKRIVEALDEKDKENASLRAQVEELQGEIQDMIEMEPTENRNLRQEIKDLTEQLESAKELAEDMKQGMKAEADEADDLRKDLEEAQETIRKQSKQLALKQQINEAWVKNDDNQFEQIKNQAKQINDLQAKVKELEDLLENNKKNLELERQGWTKTVKALEDENKEKEKTIHILGAHVKDTQSLEEAIRIARKALERVATECKRPSLL